MLTKEYYSTLPRFFNHDSAREFFKDVYGELFVMKSADTINDIKVYYYHLVTDKEQYLDNFHDIEQGNLVDHLDCFQDIEVTEDGHVYVVF